MLELRELIVRAGGFTLSDISLALPERQCHVFLGPTGSGKTLLLETIVGFRRPEAGSVVLDGLDITHMPIESRGISYVPQDLALFPHMTVEGNILYGLKMSNNARHRQLVDDIVGIMGIGHLLGRSVKNLSGGEKQRVALVRALATGCKRLVLDEPLSSLHEAMKTDLWFMIRDLMERYALTVYLITHDLEEAFFLGDTVSILMDGKLLQTGNNEEVRLNPQTISAARFLGFRNLFSCKVSGITENTFNVACPGLNSSISISRRINMEQSHENGQSAIIGIHPQNIQFKQGATHCNPDDNILHGIVSKIFGKGDAHILHFMPDGGAVPVEIEIPDHQLRSLGLAQNKRTTISLRPEYLHLMRNSGNGTV
jgi:ABC-type Fe3+/spermidine/putrescine transport system ATPase subunit